MTSVRCVFDGRAELGESPIWDAEEWCLYWVDILAPSLNRLDPVSGQNRSWAMPDAIGSFALCENGDAVVALRSGFFRFSFEDGGLVSIAEPLKGQNGVRFNDGKASPDGRFFAGTMDEAQLSRPLGELFRLDPDGSCHLVADGLIVSNGLAWSPDGKTLFHSDSKGKVIYAWDYDALTGAIANRRVVARPDEVVGRPDGGAFDVEGYYWSAGISAGVINRWAPDGRLERRIALPVPHPTCICFGGTDMKTLYVTTLSHTMNARERARYPLAGCIFAIDVDVAGVPVGRFRG